MKSHIKFVEERFGEDRFVCGTIYGSQNYGTDTPESDIDTIMYVLPSFEEIAFNKTFISELHKVDNGTISVRDIRALPENILSGNPVNLEILISDSFICNKNYKDFIVPIIDNAMSLCALNCDKVVSSIFKQIQGQTKKFLNTRSNKVLAHALMLHEILELFTTTFDIETAYKMIKKASSGFKSIKMHGLYLGDIELNNQLVDELVVSAKEKVERFNKSELREEYSNSEMVTSFLNDQILKLLKHFLLSDTTFNNL